MKKSQPRFCPTVSAYLVFEGKILLIKHKKLGVWIMPGGHIEVSELPHQAAEREFWEETGVKVKAREGLKSETQLVKNNKWTFLPTPFKSGLHWICEENYERRLQSKKPLAQWPKGCEQHFDLGFLVEPTEGVKYKQNLEETDGIAWFGLEEIEGLETFGDVQVSIKKAFEITRALRK